MRLALLGAGAQAKYVLEIFSWHSNVDVVGIIHLSHEAIPPEEHLLKLPVLGGVADLPRLSLLELDAAIVCCRSNSRKAQLHEELSRLGIKSINAVHPRAIVASSAEVEDAAGVIINPGAIVQPFACIGRGAMIHSNVLVEHDNVIEDYVNLGPGATLAGWVTVKERAILYTGAVVAPGITIGREAIVAAGAVVLESVPDGVTVAGAPARPIRRTNKDLS